MLLAYRLPFSLLTANRVARDFPTRRMGADKKKRWSGRQGQRDQQLEINGGAPSSYDAAYPNRHGRRKINRRAKPRHPSPSKLKSSSWGEIFGNRQSFLFLDPNPHQKYNFLSGLSVCLFREFCLQKTCRRRDSQDQILGGCERRIDVGRVGPPAPAVRTGKDCRGNLREDDSTERGRGRARTPSGERKFRPWSLGTEIAASCSSQPSRLGPVPGQHGLRAHLSSCLDG